MQTQKNILLIISGGIAAYKSLELIRLLKKNNYAVKCILTSGGAQFATPMSVAALSENTVYTDLWSLKDESEMGHIRLSREADLILVVPATANIMASMAHGICNDLATTCLLAADKPVLVAPSMNQMMWANEATQDNIDILKRRGIHFISPVSGEMACGETGLGRMEEPENIFAAVENFLSKDLPLKGKKVIITAGPTYEPIDPVRFIGNYSSGKQGIAIATQLKRNGADVTLIHGPINTSLLPSNTQNISVQTACQMLEATEKALTDCDVFISAAAVADWRPKSLEKQKTKKNGTDIPDINLVENPDILKTIGHHKNRPELVIGFAAETENLEQNAKAKLAKKGCDWIIANNVGGDKPVFGSDNNEVTLISKTQMKKWSRQSKASIAEKLTQDIINLFNKTENGHENYDIAAE